MPKLPISQVGSRLTQNCSTASADDVSLTVSYTNLTDWSVDWGHSLYAKPFYRVAQLVTN